MTIDDPGQNDPSGRPVPQDGEQPKDTVLSQEQGSEPELDAYGIPVPQRPVKGRVYVGLAASSVCVVISAWLLIVAHASHNYNLPVWQVRLGAGTGLLATFLAGMTLKRAEKEKQQLGVGYRRMLRAIAIVGFVEGALGFG